VISGLVKNIEKCGVVKDKKGVTASRNQSEGMRAARIQCCSLHCIQLWTLKVHAINIIYN
jgi:hypothetical protein